MGLLYSKTYHKRLQAAQTGLTLIEVLIALAIISIAFLAVMKAVTQAVRATAYLEQKTMAAFVGLAVINEIRAGLTISETSLDMFGREWPLKIQKMETSNPAIKRVMVKVFSDENTYTEEMPLLTLESYAYQPAS